MLPKFLVGSYKRYKSDTTRLTTWLEETAKACSTGSNPDSANGHQKKTQPGTVCKVPLKSFKALAQTIANNESKIEIPPPVLNVARRAIALRKRCSEWFKTGTRPDLRTNNTYEYFISVLEEVLNIFGVSDSTQIKPPSSSSLPKDKQDAPIGPTQRKDRQDTSVDPFVNMFSALELDEVDEAEEVVEVRDTKTKTPSKAIKVSYELDDGPQNIKDVSEMISLFCLLEDLQHIRDFLAAMWWDYRNGKTDLMTAAATTNTAFDLARQTVDEVEKSQPSLFASHEEPPCLKVALKACAVRGVSYTQHQRQGDPYNMAISDIAESCFLNTYILLNTFQNVLIDGEMPVWNKTLGVYKPEQDRSRMSLSERFNEDKIVLF